MRVLDIGTLQLKFEHSWHIIRLTWHVVFRTAVRSSVQDPEAKAKKLVITFDELTAALAQAGQGGAAGVRLVDVREPKEIEETGRLPGAINIPC